MIRTRMIRIRMIRIRRIRISITKIRIIRTKIIIIRINIRTGIRNDQTYNEEWLPGMVAAAAVYSVGGCSGEEGVIVPEIAIVILP